MQEGFFLVPVQRLGAYFQIPTGETAIMDACGSGGFIEQVSVTGANCAGSLERFTGVETSQAINKVE